jgi:hypothetical protein
MRPETLDHMPWTRADVWVLCAIALSGDWVDMQELDDSADYLMRTKLTFEELSWGVPRLEARGLVEVRMLETGPRFRATGEGKALVGSVRTRGVIDQMLRLMDRLARPYVEDEDRSLGRLEGFEPRHWPW